MTNTQHAATILVDLDGTLIRHQPHPWDFPMEVLPGVKEQMADWWSRGCHVIIVTGRPETARNVTVEGLERCGIRNYHQLIMGATSGLRFTINDLKPYAPERATALAYNVVRNKGLEDVKLW